MKFSSSLSRIALTAVPFCLISLVFLLAGSSDVLAAQIDQGPATTKKSDGQLKTFVSTINAAFKNGNEVVQQDLQKNLNIVSSLLAKDLAHAQELGFGTDPKGAKISPNVPPFLIFHVSLRDLRDFTPDKESSDLLAFTNQLLFRVEINNKVTSSLTLRLLGAEKQDHKNKELGLRVTRWGQPKLVDQLDKLTKKLPPNTEVALVAIPSLNRNFLGYHDGTDLKLVALFSDQIFEAGKPLSANKVFLILVQEARDVDGSPR
jgi:hypothetical protein